MGRRRKEEYTSSSSDEEEAYHDNRQKRRGSSGPDQLKAEQSAGTRPTCRRPVWFWWRQSLEQNGKRPNKQSIQQWYSANATTVWEHDTPSYTETRMHAKCLRSTEAVRLYFRRYRAARREHPNGTGDDSRRSAGGAAAHAPYGGRRHSEVAEDVTLDAAVLIAEHNRRVSESQAQAQAQAELQLRGGLPKGTTVTTSLAPTQQPIRAAVFFSGNGRGAPPLPDSGMGLWPDPLRPRWDGDAFGGFGSVAGVKVKPDPDGDLLSTDAEPLIVAQIAPPPSAVGPTGVTSVLDRGDQKTKAEAVGAWPQGVPPRVGQPIPNKRVSEHSSASVHTEDAAGNNTASAADAGPEHASSGPDMDAEGSWFSAHPALCAGNPYRQLPTHHMEQPLSMPWGAQYATAIAPSSYPGAYGGYGSGFPLLHPQRFLVHADRPGFHQLLPGQAPDGVQPMAPLQRTTMVPLSEVGNPTLQPPPCHAMALPAQTVPQHPWLVGELPGGFTSGGGDGDDDGGMPDVFINY